ncbi:ribonuclease H-like domain-containing protein [Tanacetum coccineum]|uniref:Ribonuclease H-like domain-containing protein n=1 Tax=Tanacetum coccineum TaxID=301880 RepID=A0ABQ4WB60_9ASTR
MGIGLYQSQLDNRKIKFLPPTKLQKRWLLKREEKEKLGKTTLARANTRRFILAKFHKMTNKQFEGFTVSNSDGIHKGYERFQSLLSQLEIHGAGVSTEDANQKFLRSLPSALVTRLSASSSNLQNMHLSLKTPSVLMKLVLFMGHFARECRTKEENRRRDGWNTGNREGRRTSNRDESISGKKEESRALVTVDGECVDWTTHSEDNDNYAFMANNSTGIQSLRFSWTFFLRTKDETSAILKDFIRQIENQLNQKVKTIRCDNGTEFKNRDIIEFCGLKGIKREYSNARTPQQNGVAERKNMTLIEAARTMLADSFLPNTFWAEAVSTACYVLNRVLVTKPHNKTPYELLTGKTPIISYIRPFGCHVTILNTIDHLGKFAGKSDEGFLVGYSLQSKAFRVYNLVTKRVEENLHIKFLENKPNVAGKGPNWLFDLDYLTDSMNYHYVSSENQANLHVGQQESKQDSGTKDKIDSGNSQIEDETDQDCFELPIWHSYSSTNKSSSKSDSMRGSPSFMLLWHFNFRIIEQKNLVLKNQDTNLKLFLKTSIDLVELKD